MASVRSPLERGLGDVVRQRELLAALPVDRGDREDPAVPAIGHAAAAAHRERDGGVEIDRQHAPVGRLCQLQGRRGLEHARDRADDVDRSGAGLDAVDERRDGVDVAQVETHLGARFHIDAGDARALRAEPLRDRPADAIGGAGDDRVTSVE